jgi:hypothetical protein
MGFFSIEKVPGKFWSRVSLHLGLAHPGYPPHSLRGPPALGPFGGALYAPCVLGAYAMDKMTGVKAPTTTIKNNRMSKALAICPAKDTSLRPNFTTCLASATPRANTRDHHKQVHLYLLLLATIVSLVLAPYTRQHKYPLVLEPLTDHPSALLTRPC